MEVELFDIYDKVGFIVWIELWEKDGGDCFVLVENGEGEVWVKSGDEYIYMFFFDGEYWDLLKFDKVNVILNYYWYDGDYSGWNIWIWLGDEKEGK